VQILPAVRVDGDVQVESGRIKDVVLIILMRIWNLISNTPLYTSVAQESIDAGVPLSNMLVRATRYLRQQGALRVIHREANANGDEPHLISYYGAQSVGSDFFDAAEAYARMIGEELERYVWMHSDTVFARKSINTSYSHIRRRALNIFNLAGFSDEYRISEPRLQFTEETRFNWSLVRSLVQRRYIFCPTQLLSAKYANQAKDTEPLLRWAVTTGLATGMSIDEAITKGILEIIERDAFMITYLNKLTPPRYDLDALAKKDSRIRHLNNLFKLHNIEAYVVALPTDLPAHVSCGILVDRTKHGPQLTVGASAGFSQKETIIKSLEEAVEVRRHARQHVDRELPAKSQFSKFDRIVYWGKKKNLNSIKFLLDGDFLQGDFPEEFKTSPAPWRSWRQLLVKKFKEKGYELVYSELTNASDVKNTGLHTVVVVIPEMQPLHLYEAAPYFGGERIHSVPKRLGYGVASELNTEPHPFP
jgi:ribosomal protein S12 methylthiotransferase accessory factor